MNPMAVIKDIAKVITDPGDFLPVNVRKATVVAVTTGPNTASIQLGGTTTTIAGVPYLKVGYVPTVGDVVFVLKYGTALLILGVINTDASGSGVPSGTILGFGGSSAPSGYLPCDGSAVSRTTYAKLFAVIGTAYGAGNGTTTFNVPNYNSGNNFMRGGSPGGTGGASSSTPSWSGSISVSDSGHTHSLSDNGAASIELQATASPNIFMRRVGTSNVTSTVAGTSSTTPTGTSATIATGAALTGNTDSGTANVSGSVSGTVGSVSTIPPYVQALYIIKT